MIQKSLSLSVKFIYVCVLHVLNVYLSLFNVCMCMYCMYVHLFVRMHFLQLEICQSDFPGGKRFPGLSDLAQVMTN
jgi:hypothetical protein